MIDPDCQTCRLAIKARIGVNAAKISVCMAWANDGWDAHNLDAMAEKIKQCRKALDEIEALTNLMRPIDFVI